MDRKERFSRQGSANHRVLQSAAVFMMAAIGMLAPARAELTILNGNYQVETYAQYQQQTVGGLVRYMTADSQGNVYIGHGASPSSVVVASEGSTSVLATGFGNLQGVEWTGGSSYGDFVYIANTYGQNIKKVDTSGNVSTFATLPYEPLVLALDGSGNYGNKLYAATRNSTRIYSINASGGVSQFANLGSLTDGFPLDIAIDPTGRYNGSMYVCLANVTNTNYQGILAIDPQGNVTQYRAGGYWGTHLVFDSTPEAVFGGDLFLGGGSAIKHLTPEGDIINLLLSDRYIEDFVFGADGALYVMEVTSSSTFNDTVTISKITAVPEPATLLLLGIGAMTALRSRKRNA